MKAPFPVLALAFVLLNGCLQAGSTPKTSIQEFSELYENGTSIAICDPSHCPAGRYAYMFISNIESVDPEKGRKLRENIVTNDQNVRAVLDKVLTREVDAGFVYLTDAELEKENLRIIEVPREYSPLPQYGIAVVRTGDNKEGADQFISYVLSDEGQNTLKEYGFPAAVEDPAPFEANLTAEKEKLTVYAASSLTDVFTEISRGFEKRTGYKVEIGFGSSGTLRARIEGGAPADVYATASLRHAEILQEAGLIEEYAVFARNHLVVVTHRGE
jgi:molybdate transport system substrate-binding protein